MKIINFDKKPSFPDFGKSKPLIGLFCRINRFDNPLFGIKKPRFEPGPFCERKRSISLNSA